MVEHDSPRWGDVLEELWNGGMGITTGNLVAARRAMTVGTTTPTTPGEPAIYRDFVKHGFESVSGITFSNATTGRWTSPGDAAAYYNQVDAEPTRHQVDQYKAGLMGRLEAQHDQQEPVLGQKVSAQTHSPKELICRWVQLSRQYSSDKLSDVEDVKKAFVDETLLGEWELADSVLSAETPPATTIGVLLRRDLAACGEHGVVLWYVRSEIRERLSKAMHDAYLVRGRYNKIIADKVAESVEVEISEGWISVDFLTNDVIGTSLATPMRCVRIRLLAVKPLTGHTGVRANELSHVMQFAGRERESLDKAIDRHVAYLIDNGLDFRRRIGR